MPIIIAIKPIGTGFELTLNVSGELTKVKTYMANDGYLKINLNSETFELVGLTKLKRG